jgi:hypothetical protein
VNYLHIDLLFQGAGQCCCSVSPDAKPEDFKSATQRVYRSGTVGSGIEVGVMRSTAMGRTITDAK